MSACVAAHARAEPRASTVERADAVVIGAGPAGSVAATLLARQGMRVTLVERERFPRTKVCGCCLGPRGVAALESAHLGEAIAGASALESVSLAHGRHWIALPLAGTRVIGRDVMDSRLADAAARAGCQVRIGSRACVVSPGSATEAAQVQVEDVATGASCAIRARLVVCADGIGGRSLAPLCGEGAWSVDPRSRFGVSATLPHAAIDVPPHHLWMMSHADGYVGAVRLPSGDVDIAAALDPAAARRAGGPGALIASVVERCGQRLSAGSSAQWKGTPALTRRRAWVARDRVICVGDAAGYIEPFTGEGMSWAIEGAVAAASAAPHIIASGDTSSWASTLMATVGAHQRRCRRVATMLRFPRATMCALRAAARVPGVRRRLGAIATGVS
jgi:2-polyprenyl-6-methoxyphenol hydroxylase-like FAD-dependent oxidoreductase